ncbi:MAG: amidohydrolase [Caulobacteraceae bacterium]|nr:amidohydrolase [Caulobacteraceae bacterium]
MTTHPSIDAHQHFWRYDPPCFPWIAPGSVLAADHLPAQLAPQLAANEISQTIAVQAQPTEAETRWLLGLAGQHDWIAGVVGWTDLQAEDIEHRLDALSHPKLIGLRHMVQDEPDPQFLLRPAFIAGVRAAVRRGWTYDLLLVADQLPLAPRFIEAVGEGRFVLDHGAKPRIAQGGWEPWASAIREVAAFPNVWCKVSGLITEANHASWTAADIAPYLDHLLACFGAERLIFGSDWPVCRLAGSYRQVHGLIADFVARACPEHAASMFADAARAAYSLHQED